MSGNVHSELLEAIKNYHMPAAAVELLRQHKPLIIAGVSSAGKNSVADYLKESGSYTHVTTHTTRQYLRQGEENGKDYWFVNDAQMLQLLKSEKMIEAKLVHGETIYGTSIEAYKSAIKSGQRPLWVIDVQGVEQVTKNIPGLSAAFVLPPTFEVWMERMDKRGQMSHVERVRRLKSAGVEMEHVLRNKHFNLFVNRDISMVANQIMNGVVVPADQHHSRDLIHRLIESIRAY